MNKNTLSEASICRKIQAYLDNCRRLMLVAVPLNISGRLERVAGLVLEVHGLQLPTGAGAMVDTPDGRCIYAEVVGFNGDRLFLMPTEEPFGLAPGARVFPLQAWPLLPVLGEDRHPKRRAVDRTKHLPVGRGLLGRVLDANGDALDQLGPVHAHEMRSQQSRPMNPLKRQPITVAMDVGVRAINALLTVGRGQRMGIFAGSGVGKSVLLGMMARYTQADVVIVGLIGERGREVKEFIEQILGAEGLARSIVIAVPADASPLLRMQGASYTTMLAEFFRDQGQHVLLIMDSLTRYAMAQREIALAVGEPPVTRGYPPSVFAKLPALVERAGNGDTDGGSITAFYTVLTEGDDQQDPIADAARAILDGHIVLSRSLADSGHYPAIDIEASISRVMPSVVEPIVLDHLRLFKQTWSRYERSRDLISVGAYVPGSDQELDKAIALHPQLANFLQQGMFDSADLASSQQVLAGLLSNVEG